MNRQEFVLVSYGSDFHLVQIHAHLPAAGASGALAPRGIDEDMPHGLSGSSEEMFSPGKSS